MKVPKEANEEKDKPTHCLNLFARSKEKVEWLNGNGTHNSDCIWVECIDWGGHETSLGVGYVLYIYLDAV